MKYINAFFLVLLVSFFFSCGSNAYDRELEKEKIEKTETLRLELGNLNLDGENLFASSCKNPIDNVRLEKILE